jgi:glycosyltransferase involved in cell wall biosynthesis
MRVLVVHNNYSSRVPSGENLAVRDEVAWLRSAGIDVHLHEAHNDDVLASGTAGRTRQALWGIWSQPAKRAMEDRIRAVEPDVVHLHNAFPVLTGSVVRAALDLRLPVVWTVHNHRVTCIDGGNFRNGASCTQCRPGWRLPGIVHACYAESAAASAVVTASTGIFRSLARRRVTPVAISGHLRDWLVRSAGFDADRVVVKHNGVSGPPDDAALTPAADSRDFLFLGRLAPHKGIGLLLEAWERTRGRLDGELHILGDGPLGPAVQEAADRDGRIRWFGAVPHDEVGRHLGAARAVVVPALWDEPFGRVATEALAYRRGLIATRRGGLGEIVDPATDWVVDPVAGALADALVDAARPEADIARRAEAGHARYQRSFSPAATTEALVAIYKMAVGGGSAIG